MFQNMTTMQFLQQGGIVLLVLSICSVLSFSVMIERFLVYHLAAGKIKRFAPKLIARLRKSGVPDAILLCGSDGSVFSDMMLSALERKGKTKDIIEDAIKRSGVRLYRMLEKRLAILATLGAITPFVGLLGTVIGIIKTFQAISLTDSYSAGLVSAGIAEALLNTAAGLFVAIPAVIAYNYFAHKSQVMLREVESFSSEVIELVME